MKLSRFFCFVFVVHSRKTKIAAFVVAALVVALISFGALQTNKNTVKEKKVVASTPKEVTQTTVHCSDPGPNGEIKDWEKEGMPGPGVCNYFVLYGITKHLDVYDFYALMASKQKYDNFAVIELNDQGLADGVPPDAEDLEWRVPRKVRVVAYPDLESYTGPEVGGRLYRLNPKVADTSEGEWLLEICEEGLAVAYVLVKGKTIPEPETQTVKVKYDYVKKPFIEEGSYEGAEGWNIQFKGRTAIITKSVGLVPTCLEATHRVIYYTPPPESKRSKKMYVVLAKGRYHLGKKLTKTKYIVVTGDKYSLPWEKAEVR
ncbi:TPA: hypothetical protein DDW69_04430 [candidate division CPR2 bacterium]|uniref:Uncharacterized protein n=1 Tax=candidate division CPR2 bacterium GW2011_GWC1_41_48 TaxID=1618344 RepID=A0A0G0WB44_UNCC2|nr:MAG: hypothetical protein UT47_C0002G0234 [candidate division CPR2 bacterium GW2011_GWC2_39_35]KKR29093.1 MAG: hypothetical protein UT60_C0007G0038 [candidate division CPR2 bacterium GW2011_GWD2_39_7]KKS09292.1 MAG: hypothetical protein UU65_C0002G0070 [candidate division CPR2 bacterium GW2011_GWC1_41_48]OGB70580.1 MAG: hypothetical protein A2Y26_04550 [candidate division CPR2 bacterium GWD2_39_7]HBG82049.1 hypothetical protein [candidate division CPR2 bacterium]